tara:strand:+ start:84 stop:743 length:660 start_codon:yes stop_codon:yes gene_type:complete
MMSELIKRLLSSLVLIPVALFFIIKGSFFFKFFMIIFLLVAAYEWNSLSKRKNYQLPGFIFLTVSIYMTILLRGNTNFELYLFLFAISICVATDIGGYIFGNIFKGPKILKSISPNKTYAGSIGGYLLSIIFIYFFLKNSYLIGDDLPNYFGKYEFIWVLFISTISQVGDFIISYFKRKSNIKNTGSIIPGHGGLLDRADGMIFALPFSYIFFNLFSTY